MWQDQLKAVHDDCGINGVRFHGSFDDDMGPVATGCDAITGRHCTWNFTGLDVLYDGILAANVKPIVELSFMPTSMANCSAGHCPTGMHYRGVEAHPKSYEAWGDLVGAFVAHLVERVRAAPLAVGLTAHDLAFVAPVLSPPPLSLSACL
jgi:xylan 1,4-beta-xylosidase